MGTNESEQGEAPMFTGIVMGRGELAHRERRGDELRLSVRALFPLPDLAGGESVAVNGVCLTVEQPHADGFSAYASARTLSRTNLSSLPVRAALNLERALAVGDRLGGHIVSGHVDAVGTVVRITPAGQSRCVRLAHDPQLAPEIIARGSITLDGVSLTVNDCGSDFLEVNVIPETWNRTTLSGWNPGTPVNMETDIIGKYVRHVLATRQEGERSRVTLALLRENGFL
jgi:riboflavin synthase